MQNLRVPEVVPAWMSQGKRTRWILIGGGGLLCFGVLIASLPGKRQAVIEAPPDAAKVDAYDPALTRQLPGLANETVFRQMDAFILDERRRILATRAFELQQEVGKELKAKKSNCAGRPMEACLDLFEQSFLGDYRKAAAKGDTTAAHKALGDYLAINVLRGGGAELEKLRPESLIVHAEEVRKRRSVKDALELELESEQVVENGGEF